VAGEAADAIPELLGDHQDLYAESHGTAFLIRQNEVGLAALTVRGLPIEGV
jgi:hypothetical protein